MKKIVYPFILLISLMIINACDSDDSGDGNPAEDSFDRSAMLAHWADNLIVPAYQNFQQTTNALKSASDDFINQTTENNLISLRLTWENAYLSYQNIAMYNAFGPADDARLLQFLNIYPTNTAAINSAIQTESYDLSSLASFTIQGFPALDYLLYGLADNTTEVIEIFDNDNDGQKYRQYLNELVTRINTLSTTVLADWQNTYRDNFVQNTGASVNGSINIVANAYLEFYEVVFRNGKIGFPAGVFSSGNTPDPSIVEAPFRNDFSKTLCLEGLEAFQNFFNGGSPLSSVSGPSFKSYLDFLDTMKDGENLSTLIDEQFEVSRQAINNLDNSFADQINTNNNLMLVAFEELQDNVVYLKSDMFSALSITLDFESGDGD